MDTVGGESEALLIPRPEPAEDRWDIWGIDILSLRALLNDGGSKECDVMSVLSERIDQKLERDMTLKNIHKII